MALLTKLIGIVTPLILSIVVVVAPEIDIAPRHRDKIVSYKASRLRHKIASYGTRWSDRIVQGFDDGMG